jgi:hypothetical protein
MVLRIQDWQSGDVYAETPVKEGDTLFFAWTHSLEKIPWNEYYHVNGDGNLILDAITFTAFGAGIPENKGKVCYVKDGLIHMEQIDQLFPELVWLNSRFTGDIAVNGVTLTRGTLLPDHVRLKLYIDAKQRR